MLVLSRKAGEWLDLLLPDGRAISLQVVEVRNHNVRLGIDAPHDVAVYRREITPESREQSSPGGAVPSG